MADVAEQGNQKHIEASVGTNIDKLLRQAQVRVNVTETTQAHREAVGFLSQVLENDPTNAQAFDLLQVVVDKGLIPGSSIEAVLLPLNSLPALQLLKQMRQQGSIVPPAASSVPLDDGTAATVSGAPPAAQSQINMLIEQLTQAYYEGRYQEAVNLSLQILQIDPNNQGAREYQAKADDYLCRGVVADARIPLEARTKYNRALSAIRASLYEDAQELLEEALEIAQDAGIPRWSDVEGTLFQLEDLRLAEELHKKGDEFASRDNWEEALEKYENSLRIVDTPCIRAKLDSLKRVVRQYQQVDIKLAVLSRQLTNKSQEIEALQADLVSALIYWPDSARLRELLAKLDRQSERQREARTLEVMTAALARTETQLQSGQYELARQETQELLKQVSAEAHLRTAVQDLLAHIEKHAQAEQHYCQAIAATDSYKYEEAQSALAAIANLGIDLPAAHILSERIQREREVGLLLAQAEALARTRNFEEAQRMLDEASYRNPTHPRLPSTQDKVQTQLRTWEQQILAPITTAYRDQDYEKAIRLCQSALTSGVSPAFAKQIRSHQQNAVEGWSKIRIAQARRDQAVARSVDAFAAVVQTLEQVINHSPAPATQWVNEARELLNETHGKRLRLRLDEIDVLCADNQFERALWLAEEIEAEAESLQQVEVVRHAAQLHGRVTLELEHQQRALPETRQREKNNKDLEQLIEKIHSAIDDQNFILAQDMLHNAMRLCECADRLLVEQIGYLEREFNELHQMYLTLAEVEIHLARNVSLEQCESRILGVLQSSLNAPVVQQLKSKARLLFAEVGTSTGLSDAQVLHRFRVMTLHNPHDKESWIAYERLSTQLRLKEAKEKRDKELNVLTQDVKREARWWLTGSLFSAVFVFAIIIYAAVALLQGSAPVTYLTPLYAALSGIVSALFLRQYDQTNQRLDTQQRQIWQEARDYESQEQNRLNDMYARFLGIPSSARSVEASTTTPDNGGEAAEQAVSTQQQEDQHTTSLSVAGTSTSTTRTTRLAGTSGSS